MVTKTTAVKKTATKTVAAPAAKPAKKVAAVAAAPAKKGFPARTPGAVKKVRKPLPQFAAPADFKPHFLLIEVHTEKDGLIGGVVSATRYVGRFDPAAEDKKKFALGDYDQDTLRGITARLAAITYKATSERFFSNDPAAREGVRGSHRLPKSAVFHVLMRVGVKKADNTIMVRVKDVFQRVTKKSVKTGKPITKSAQLLRTDPVRRLIARAGRILPAAFKNVMMPPKRTRGSRAEASEE